MAINPLSTVSAIGGAMKTIYNKTKQQSSVNHPDNEYYGSGGAGTNTSLPLKPDGSPAWIGGKGNPNYMPAYSDGSFSWQKAERSRLRAIENAKKRQEKLLAQQYESGKSMLAGQVQTGRRQLAEYLAQTGRLGSGTMAQAQISSQGQLMQGLGTLEASRETSLAEIERQRDEARATIMAEAASRQQAEAEQAYERDVAGIQAGAYNQDIQAEINRRMAINPNDPTIPILQAQRNQKLAGIAEAEAEAQQQQFENQLALEKLAISRSKASGGGGVGVTGGYEPSLTAAQARSAFDSGMRTQNVIDAMNYHFGTDYQFIDGLNSAKLDEYALSIRKSPSQTDAIARLNYFKNKGLTQAQLNYIQSKL